MRELSTAPPPGMVRHISEDEEDLKQLLGAEHDFHAKRTLEAQERSTAAKQKLAQRRQNLVQKYRQKIQDEDRDQVTRDDLNQLLEMEQTYGQNDGKELKQLLKAEQYIDLEAGEDLKQLVEAEQEHEAAQEMAMIAEQEYEEAQEIAMIAKQKIEHGRSALMRLSTTDEGQPCGAESPETETGGGVEQLLTAEQDHHTKRAGDTQERSMKAKEKLEKRRQKMLQQVLVQQQKQMAEWLLMTKEDLEGVKLCEQATAKQQAEAALAKFTRELQNLGDLGVSIDDMKVELNLSEQKLAEAKKSETEVEDLRTTLNLNEQELIEAKKSEAEVEELKIKFNFSEVELVQAKTKLRNIDMVISEGRELALMAQEDNLEQQVRARLEEKVVLLEPAWDKLLKEQALRKKLHNVVQDMKGAVRVFARCRPLSKTERKRGELKGVVSVRDMTTLAVAGPRGEEEFTFDSVFGPTATQDRVFDEAKALLESVLYGYNVCVFAYGQTGSGKTWTMTGNGDDPGLTPRCVHTLFTRIQEMDGVADISVQSYFLELYRDELCDLYFKVKNPRAKSPKLEVKLDHDKMVFVKGATLLDVHSAEELMSLFKSGNSKRQVSATAMNSESSRSHSVFSLLVRVTNRKNGNTCTGKLSLIDLAGSEKAKKTGATKEQLKEASSINSSLSVLGDVIKSLSVGSKHVRYRDNKLTQLMQDSLGGTAKTLMFVNISPAEYNREETIGSLKYASRAKDIKNDVTQMTDTAEISKLKDIIRKLQTVRRPVHDVLLTF